MTNIQNNMLLNIGWSVFFLLALTAFICIASKANAKDKGVLYGFLLLSISICYRAVLVYCYYRMTDAIHSIVVTWQKNTVITSSIHDLLITTTILVFLLDQIKEMLVISRRQQGT